MASSHATSPQLSPLRAGLRTLAVTGTNGKTTTTSMLAAILEAAGETPVRVTSLGAWVGGERIASDASWSSFLRTIEYARTRGASSLALEVTSRALQARFAERWPADTAIFTNLTRDHLDLHGSPERYLAAKAQLFMHLAPAGLAVLNAADPASALLAEVMGSGRRICGFRGSPRSTSPGIPVALAAEHIELSEFGTRIELERSPLSERLGGHLELSVIGSFNVDNALAAAVAADGNAVPPDAIVRGLAKFSGVPGRFEVVNRRPLLVVDFAHTPDALERVLRTARALVAKRAGRVGCVFGCGGERDAAKRPLMGAVAAQLADAVWLTTDNPRGEDPDAIAAMVRSGAAASATWAEIADRAEAIYAAVCWARLDDVVVIAGRGAESAQQLRGGSIAFVDRDVVARALSACANRT